MRFRTRALNLWQFIKILRVEPLMFMMAFQMTLKNTPGSQMIQDKICMHWYNTTGAYCHDLPSTREDDSLAIHGHFKSKILADSSQFGTYYSYIYTPPGIIWALFIGAWMDRYIRARKVILIASCVCGILENLIHIYLSLDWDASVYYNLIAPLPALLVVGGGAGPRIAATHYMTSTTPLHLMAIRFMLFQTCLTLAMPLGSSLGGYFLVQKPAFGKGQIRNFTMCFIIAAAFEVVALLWTLFVINEDVAKKQQVEIEMELEEQNNNMSKNQEDKLPPEVSKVDKQVHPIKLLFDLKNFKAMIKTLIKQRPNKGRTQVILILMSLGILMGEFIGISGLNYQFFQKAYLWNPDWASYMSSINMIVSSISTMVLVPLLSKVLKVPDIPLALYGFITIVLNNIIKGSWVEPNAYYTTMAITGLGGAGLVCSKAHLSKIVDRDEMGKVMSFLTTMETISPMIFTTIFTYIFNYTIDTYPGTVYQVMAGLTLIPYFTMIWIDLFTERPIEEMVKGNDQWENQQGDKKLDSLNETSKL